MESTPLDEKWQMRETNDVVRKYGKSRNNAWFLALSSRTWEMLEHWKTK
jgi:hypothetical protein